jgi:D-arabinose 1-dehydrogenase-like Zn-dependent alcohol dehydrogenase
LAFAKAREILAVRAAAESRRHDTIAIVGQRPVGLSATQLAAAMGARVIAFDVSTERPARASDAPQVSS